MCIAIYQPSGKQIEEDTLRACFENNGDGCGLAYINVDHKNIRKIMVKKSMSFDKFLKDYRRAKINAPDSPFLIHFRIRTHGEVSTYNCHPFSVDDDHVFIHNGIIPGMRADKIKNDTQMFNRDCLRKLPKGWLYNEGIATLISQAIGNSKIAVMDIDGSARIYNEAKGSWVDGVWFSNTSYKPRPVYTPTAAGRTSLDNSGKGDYFYKGWHKWTPSDEYKYAFGSDADETGDTEDGVWYEGEDDDLEELTEDHEILCDVCNKYHAVTELIYYLEKFNIYPKAVCSSCLTGVAGTFAIYESKRRISTRCYLDYINSEDNIDFYEDEYKYTEEWTNPWGLVVQTMEEADEYQEA